MHIEGVEDVDSTIFFIKKVDRAIDLLNSSRSNVYGVKGPIRREQKYGLDFADEFIHFLNSLQYQVLKIT